MWGALWFQAWWFGANWYGWGGPGGLAQPQMAVMLRRLARQLARRQKSRVYRRG